MILLYDNSFEGFLTVIFECYRRKIAPDDIRSEFNYQEKLFAPTQFIDTDTEKAERVWKGIYKKLSVKSRDLPYHAFVSEEEGIELDIFEFFKMVLASDFNMDGNYSDPAVLHIQQAAQRVRHEAMRMIQFVRFQQTKDNIYFSGLSPRYDVLPFVLKHFQDRFADQHWLLYDLKRDYGFYYNLKKIEEVTINEKSFATSTGSMPMDMVTEDEAPYQRMWQNYCKSITIKERINLKLHKQHMPRRFWKYLTEKKATTSKPTTKPLSNSTFVSNINHNN